MLTRHSFTDDAFIGFTYVRHALEGHGFVFNPDVRVEGVTNIGWLLFLLPFAAVLSAQERTRAAIIVLAAAFVVRPETVLIAPLRQKKCGADL